MSIVERGQAEIEQREREAQARRERWYDENRRHTISRFRQDFYRHLYIRNPDKRAWSRVIPGPDMPEVTDWDTTGPGDTRAPSTFICEGIRYACRWEYRGGSDRADWDDGWWPQWFVVVERPRFFGLLRRREEIQVHGPAQVAEALA
ncbi:MAG: hypothetical protein K0S82_17 [Gaiellaceae bacterium]|jgi:hypothetical protein|nr:hypothetical protein [Gaiellaceae bacterium]